MKSFIVFLTIIFTIIENGQTIQFCPSKNGCMDETRINCNNSTRAPTDFHCCPGLECVPKFIPRTDTQDAYNTTMCVNASSKAHQVKTNINVPPLKTAPIMAPAWSAAVTYYNMSNGDTGWGYFWYDVTHKAIRTDYYPTCPFLQLYKDGVNANYVPCSVLFYEGHHYYVYPSAKVCCNYTFPVWYPDWLCVSNATYNGTLDIDGIEADFWMFEWFSNFPGRGPVRNLRNMYTKADSNVPLRFREDLVTGYSDFHDYIEGTVDPSIFTSVIEGSGPCHLGHGNEGTTDRTCTKYPAMSLRRSWPCDNPTCS